MSAWTKPYHGVQHLNGLRAGFQITVYDRDGFAECLVFLPGHGFNAKRTHHADAAEARAHGEKQASELEARA
ncbi:hypothetical protein [Stenotrophomonas sp. NLF4-10]|uniref:hypothetical protein n=1 Tax=Stenotrophomonas sp. NLF4-10 TaxID=2918754 RepID=UPI001EFB5906|nr:hypothetical protein [Stenotrophomonas sp. NLF4-10]MCG8275376.1 hypothetical protein [Stenotrophomonas sp. NLF4-10]